MDWSKVIAVTNRALCKGDFLAQVERAAALGVRGIILREKDLPPEAYRKLAGQVMEICRERQVDCILHKFVEIAQELHCPNLHLPLADLLKQREMAGETVPGDISMQACKSTVLDEFQMLGASVHSAEEALLAQRAGCDYVVAGHIYRTDCKKNLAPRGIDFLQDVCKTVSIPVFGIGGIRPDNMYAALDAGAAGVCMMSAFMR